MVSISEQASSQIVPVTYWCKTMLIAVQTCLLAGVINTPANGVHLGEAYEVG